LRKPTARARILTARHEPVVLYYAQA